MTAPQFAFLGTSAAVGSASRDNTSLVFEAGGAAEYHADLAALADEARAHFDGLVEVAEELRPYSF